MFPGPFELVSWFIPRAEYVLRCRVVRAAAALRPDDDFSKLRVKQLRELLLAHGESCEGCVEKVDFERKLREAVIAAQQGR